MALRKVKHVPCGTCGQYTPSTNIGPDHDAWCDACWKIRELTREIEQLGVEAAKLKESRRRYDNLWKAARAT